MNTRLAGVSGLLAVLGLGTATGCGSGGGGGGGVAPDTRRTILIPHVVETSGRCVRVAVGDVNGDGVEDLLVQEDDLASVQVLLADVSGPGEPPVPRAPQHAVPYLSAGHVLVWDTTNDLCVGDVDGDGAPDLVVAAGDQNAVGVWRLDPVDRLRYLDPVLVPLDCPASRVAVGDVNGDGTADLVCLDESLGRVRLCIQSSSTPLSFTVDASPPDVGACFGLVCCDLDRDGHLDLVTNRPAADGMRWMPLSSSSGVISPRDHASGLPTGRCMAVGDVDGDGWMDVCLLAEGGLSLACLHQDPAQPGSFTPTTSPLSIAIDESGVHVSVPAVQRRGVVGGCGNGNFTAQAPTGTHYLGIAIDEPGVHVTDLCVAQPGLALADLDQDGRLDVCARCGDGTSDVTVCYGSAPASFSSGERHASDGWTGPLCCVADLDGDGTLDLVGCDPAAHTVNPLYAESHTEVTNPLFSPGSSLQLPFLVTDVAMDDMDRDGHLDLVCATPIGVRICWGDGAGGFLPPEGHGLAVPLTAVAVGDVDGDGRLNVVAIGAFTETLYYNGLGPRKFGILSSGAVPSPDCRAIALGDVDGDGGCDVVCAFATGAFFAHGNLGGFQPYDPIPSGVADPRACALADVDCDGDLDVFVCGLDGTAVVQQVSSSSLVWSPKSNLRFAGGVRVAAGDVDGDGRCDVCVVGAGGAVCALQDPIVRGRFQGSHALSLDACGGSAIGDLNGDGRLDLCFVETTAGQIRCRNAGPNDDSPFSLRLNGLPPGEPVLGTLTVVGDLDGDGRLDLLTVSPELGSLATNVRAFVRTAPPPGP